MGKVKRKDLTESQLRKWIANRSFKEIRTLARLIGFRGIDDVMFDGELKGMLEIQPRECSDKELKTMAPADALHLLFLREMGNYPNSFIDRLKRVVDYSFNHAIDQKLSRIEGKRPPTDLELCVKTWYLKMYKKHSYERIQLDLDFPSVDAVKKLIKRTKARIENGECSQLERRLLAFVHDNGIDDLARFYNPTK